MNGTGVYHQGRPAKGFRATGGQPFTDHAIVFAAALRQTELAAVEIGAAESHRREVAGLMVAERRNFASGHREASRVRRTQYVLGFCPYRTGIDFRHT
jgi:hypothetical protein